MSRLARSFLLRSFLTISLVVPAVVPVSNAAKGAAKGNAPVRAESLKPYLAFVGEQNEVIASKVVADRAGNIYVGGLVFLATSDSDPSIVPYDLFVTKLDPDGHVIFRHQFGGSGFDTLSSLGIDADGNVWVTGTTSSSDFPLKNPVQSELRGQQDAFIAKLNRDGDQLLFSTYFGGETADEAQALAVDDAGNAYITGSTSSQEFPVTPSAYQPTATPAEPIGFSSDAFVAKFSAGGALAYSTYLGGRTTTCGCGGSCCVGAASVDRGTAIAVDSEGNAVVARIDLAEHFGSEPKNRRRIQS